MLNQVNLMGRLTATPELKSTPSGVSATSFTIAVDRDYQSNGERQTDFITIVAWRSTAEFICRNFSKGKLIAVVGSIETRNWTATDGSKRYATEVIADKVYFAGDKKESGKFNGKIDGNTRIEKHTKRSKCNIIHNSC